MNIQKKMVTFLDAENGTKIKPIIIDQVTGEKIGTRAIRQRKPDDSW